MSTASQDVDTVDGARRRGRRRAVISIAVVLLVLAGIFYYAYSYIDRPSDKPAAGACASATSPTSAAPTVDPKTVRVDVYNATRRSGLAAGAAKAVAAHGFTTAKVANDPQHASIPGPAQVRFGPSGAAGAQAVAALVPGAQLAPDNRRDAGVDLVLGDGFTAVAGDASASAGATGTNAPATTPAAPAASTSC